MKTMKSVLPKAGMIFLIFTLLCGVIYTGVVTGIAQLIFPDNANGSIIEVDGKKYGCELLGQQYTDEAHMWGRIMNIDVSTYTDENGKALMYAAPSNLSPASEEYAQLVAKRVEKLRASRNDFRRRHQFHAVPLQLGLVPCAVVAVPGKTIQLPDNDDIKDSTFTVLNHLLELRSIIRFCRDGTVDIVLHHREAVLLCIGSTFPYLTFNGFFALTVSRIAGIDHGGHGRHLHLYIIERWSVLSK